MNEARIRGDFVNTMKSRYRCLALSTRDAFPYEGKGNGNGSKPTTPLVYPQKGLPDTWVFTPTGRHVFIEAKYARKSYRFAQWEEHQREWAETWSHTGPYWLLIGLGFERVNCKDPKLRRKLFLLPRAVVLRTEQIMEERAGLASIPMIGTYGGRVVNRDYENGGLGLSADILWSDFKLPWKDGGRIIPENHEFYWLYLREEIVEEEQEVQYADIASAAS